MKKRIFPRIIGILSGIVIIASLFLPFIKDAGTLYEIYTVNKQMYLLIAIGFFGLLPIILYAVGKKTEYGYMSVGAMLFFVMFQLTNIIAQNSIKTLDIGFYIMVGGIVVLTLVTFIVNKKSNESSTDEQIVPMSNNISNPLERNGLDASIGEDNFKEEYNNSNGVNNLYQEQNPSTSVLSSNNIDANLGVEIPDVNVQSQPDFAQQPIPDDNVQPQPDISFDDSQDSGTQLDIFGQPR